MMNKKRILGAALALLVSAQMFAGTYTFKIANPKENTKLKIQWCTTGETDLVEVKDGVATISKSDFTAQYVKIYYGVRFSFIMYLEADKDLTVNIDAQTRKLSCTGPSDEINKYLLQTPFAVVDPNAACKEEADYIKTSDSVYNVNLELLKKADLPANFKRLEKKRLLFKSYSRFPLYPSHHPFLKKLDSYKPTSLFMNKMKELTVVDAECLNFADYGYYLMDAIQCQAFQGGDSNKEFMSFVDANVKDAKVKSYITDSYIYDIVSKRGLDGNDNLVDFYHKNVIDKKSMEKFDATCKQWEILRAGSPSPSFNAPDVNGNMVSLESLKGKYVYIDIWATWCGPCRGELPYMTKLEEQYAGKDIHFVGLSCDSNKSAWEKRIQKGDMKGIQLHLGTKSDFMQKYLINGIPRFVLLDREGRIIKANAPRPSDPNITKIFDELLKK